MLIDGKRASDRAIELVLRYYAAFNRGDSEGLLALLSEDVIHDANQGTREVGIPAFREFLARMATSYREQIGDLVVTSTQDGTRAAAEYMVKGHYVQDDAGLPPARGQPYTLSGGAFFAIREGRIARVTNYYNLADWIAQIGG
jgi:steroid delta-isomerase-like uncharacterized protein